MKGKNFSDWAVAIAVILCSVVLLLALVFALNGIPFGASKRTLLVNFQDVTGVNPSANVKYAGAMAGKVIGIRMLSAAERKASGNPANAVQVTLALDANVPDLPSDIVPSVAADTLLSDKFISLSAGSIDAPALASGSVLQGITPVTFDQLARNLDQTIEGVAGLLRSSGAAPTGDLFARVNALLTQVQELVASAHPVLNNVQTLTSDAQRIIGDNKDKITSALGHFDSAANSLDQLATRSTKLLSDNERRITGTLMDLKITMENLKVTSTYSKILLRSLAERPSMLIWGGGKPPQMPTEQQILRNIKPTN